MGEYVSIYATIDHLPKQPFIGKRTMVLHMGRRSLYISHILDVGHGRLLFGDKIFETRSFSLLAPFKKTPF